MMNDGVTRSFSTRRLLMRWNILTNEASVCAWLGVCHMAPTRAVPETNGRRRWWHHPTSHPSASGLVAQFRALPPSSPRAPIHKESPAPRIHLTPPHVMSCTHTLGLGPVSSTQNSPLGSFWVLVYHNAATSSVCGGWNISVCPCLSGIFLESLGGSPASCLSFEDWKTKVNLWCNEYSDQWTTWGTSEALCLKKKQQTEKRKSVSCAESGVTKHYSCSSS